MNQNSCAGQRRNRKVVLSFTQDQYKDLACYCEINAVRPSTFIYSETIKFLRVHLAKRQE